MTYYTCRCTDGPAKGKKFQDYGPSVIADIPHNGRLLKYQLVSVLDRGCNYRFHGLSEDRTERTHERPSDLP